MRLRFHTVHPRLRPYVAHLWTVESPGYLARDIRTIVPNGRMKLVFPFRGSLANGALGQPLARNPQDSLWLLGASDRPSVVDAEGPFGVLSLEFRPGAAYRFFQFPVREMTNHVVPLPDVLGPFGREWQERLVDEPFVEGKITLLQKLLLSLLENQPPSDPVVDQAIELIHGRLGWVGVGELSERLGFSPRYVTMKFERLVGLPPKTVTEIVRFQNRFRVLSGLSSLGAFEDRYFDQSHFIREFKRFTGLSPRAYTAASNEFLNLFQQSTSDSYNT